MTALKGLIVAPIFYRIAALVVAAFLLGPGVRMAVTGDLPATDLKTYYLAGIKIAEGEPLYLDEDQGNRFTSPPVFALLFVPLAGFSLETAYLLWYPIMLAAWVGCLVLARRLFRPWFLISWPVAVAVTVLLSRTLMNHLQRGQVNLLILLMVLAALILVEGRRRWSGGVVAGAATALKIYPAFLLPYWLWKRQWSAATGMLAGWVGLWGLGVVILGPAALGRWFSETVSGSLSSDLPADFFIPYPPYSLMNQSIFAALLRLFSTSSVTDDHGLNLFDLDGVALQAIVLLGAVAFVGATLVSIPRRGSGQRFLEYSQIHLLMLLAVPLVWKANFVFLLVPYLVLIALWQRGEEDSRWAGRVLVLSLLLQWLPKLLSEQANDAAFALSVLTWSALVVWAFNLSRLVRPEVRLPPTDS